MRPKLTGWTSEDLERSDKLLGAAAVGLGAIGTLTLAAGGPRPLGLALLAIAALGALAGGALKWRHDQLRRRERLAQGTLVPPCVLLDAATAGLFYEIGVETESPAALRLLGRTAGDHAPYVERTVHASLRARIEAAARTPGAHLIVVSGPSKAGKSRLLLEAAADAVPGAWLVAPADGAAVARLGRGRLPAAARDRALVVWVDDIEEVAKRAEGLNVQIMKAFETWRRPVIVLATHGGKGLRSTGLTTHEPSNDLLARWPPVELNADLDGNEALRVRESCPPDAARRIASEGLGEFMIAAPRLVSRLRGADCAEGQAIVWAAIDCRRAGLLRPLSELELERCYGRYLVAPATAERFRRGLEWATEPLYSKVALLRAEGGGYRAYDYLVGYAHASGRPIDSTVWDLVVTELARDEEDLAHVATAAYANGDRDRAEQACRRGDDEGSAWAAGNLGALLHAREDRVGAEAAWRRADERGDANGAYNLGVVLFDKGDVHGAEAAWRRADERGDGGGARALGRQLRRAGDLESAETAFRRADERGDGAGAQALGSLLAERGDWDDAEAAYVRADERGSPAGAFDLGVLLKKRGDLAGAEAAWRRADERGHALAASNLGFLLSERGDVDAAEVAYRRADERGSAEGAYNLGALLRDDRDDAERAEAAFRRADERGSPLGAYALGVLLLERGDDAEAEAEAEAAFRRGDERGHSESACNLGVMLRERRDLDGAEAAYRRAWQRGCLLGATNLGTLLIERGEEDGAEALWRDADAQGCGEAACCLGMLLYRRDEIGPAEAAFRRSEERGSAAGPCNLGALLWQQHQDVKGAMAAWRTADERGSAEATFNLAEMLRWQDLEADAMKAYQRADARDHARAAYEVGVRLERHGARDEAADAYERAHRRALGQDDDVLAATAAAELRRIRGGPPRASD